MFRLWSYTDVFNTLSDVDGACSPCSMLDILDRQIAITQYAGPGGFNDPDMLEIGNGGMVRKIFFTHLLIDCIYSKYFFVSFSLTSFALSILDIYWIDTRGVQGSFHFLGCSQVSVSFFFPTKIILQPLSPLKSSYITSSNSLIIGCDVRDMTKEIFDILTAPEVIAVNQDPLGKSIRLVKKNHNVGTELWTGPLSSGDLVAGMYVKWYRSLYSKNQSIK